MPIWQPGLQTNLPNVRQAHSYAIVALLTANLSVLNELLAATLTINGKPVALPGPPVLNASSIILGDVDTMPGMETSGALWCQVVAGGERDARDITMTLEESPAIFEYILSTNVDFYVNPAALASSNPFQQAAWREDLRLRLTDWMMLAVFNNSGAISLPLESQTFQQPNDTTKMTILAEIAAGYVDKGFGGSGRIYELHCNIRSEMHGSPG
jgi:hypothetical protein